LDAHDIDIVDNMKPRFLYLDLLRIGALALVVYAHSMNVLGFADPISNFTTQYFSRSIGNIGVIVFVLISGIVINHSSGELQSLKEIASFYKHRFLRIYPAFIISVIAAILCYGWYRTHPIQEAVVELVGLAGIKGATTIINGSAWFITVILLLYLAYPFLEYAVRKQPALSLIGLSIIPYLADIECTFGGNLFWYVFIFTIGIFIAQKQLYPATMHTNECLSFCCELSFYVFLLHYPILYNGMINVYSVIGVGVVITPLMQILIYLLLLWIVVITAVGLMYADRLIQKVSISFKYYHYLTCTHEV
jgi:peptidoglycan/LPS O-acetylase OafA/YrhL